MPNKAQYLARRRQGALSEGKMTARTSLTVDRNLLKRIEANTRDSRLYEPPNIPDVFWSLPSPQSFTACLTYEYGTQINYVIAASVYSSYAVAFALNNAATYTNFVACFDQYRIMKVRCKFTWFGVIGSNPLPPMSSCLDYDDAVVPTLEQQVSDRRSSQVVPPTVSFERIVVPHSAVGAYSGAFTSFGNKALMWIDSASPAVQHYGLKIYLPAAVTAQVGWNLQITMQVQFRNQL